MDSVAGLNSFHLQDGQLENDREEQFYAESLHLCSLHGVAAALRERSRMCLCNPQPPDEVHKNSSERGGHELSPDLQPTRLERRPTAPEGLQDAAGIARAAGQRQAVQDGETVGECKRRVRLGLHVAEQAELVRARTHLEGAESLQEEGAEVWMGVQAAANQAPAQSHRRHDACHQQQRWPDATDGHGETERRLSQGSRTHKGSAGSTPAPPKPTRRKKKEGKGGQMETLSP